MVFRPNGHVGIGITTPAQPLHVKGRIRASFIINTVGDGNLDFRHSSITKMSLKSDGKVVIGDNGYDNAINTPGDYRLYVVDGILTEKVKVANVNSADWADYVFESDYDLNSTEEVETFIKANKHLPNVPSAKAVSENGIDVAKMDATLLRQIEELWLHVIELKKVFTQRFKNTLEWF